MQHAHDAFDLDLLRLFDHLHHERHVTRAARRAGLSQPAMSRALQRMRAAFDDELFVRGARGMATTPRAEELAPAIRRLLESAAALRQSPAFDPKLLERSFSLAAVDFIHTEILPALAHTLRSSPGVRIVMRPQTADLDEQLETGEIDLIVGVTLSLPPNVMKQHLFDEDFVCAVRRDHPRVKRTLSLETFVELPHLLISPRGLPGSPVDDALAARGLRRRVVITTHSFHSAPLVIARSDLVLTAPRRLLVPVAKAFDLKLLPPPIPLAPFGVYSAWHPRMQHDAAHAWFRDALAVTARRSVRP